MWDNVPLMRGMAGTLFFGSVVAMLCGALYYVVHMPKLLPIRTVRLVDVPVRVDAGEVLARVRRDVNGNFLTVDIDKLRLSLEKMAWVRNVSIKREFPNRLAVEFQEHKAVARWNDEALVDSYGEVFAGETTQQLPRFMGIEGSSAEVLQQYTEFSGKLAGLNLKVTELVLSPRHAWQLRLDNDMLVKLGREDMQQRLSRFVTVYPYGFSAEPQDAAVQQVVDMRYRHGFAVHRQHA